jgi:hypothetical protein
MAELYGFTIIAVLLLISGLAMEVRQARTAARTVAQLDAMQKRIIGLELTVSRQLLTALKASRKVVPEEAPERIHGPLFAPSLGGAPLKTVREPSPSIASNDTAAA